MHKFVKKLAIYFTTGFIILIGTNSIKLCKDESKEFSNKVFLYTNLFDDDDFQIAAHRGFSSLEVENTKDSISLADKEKYIDYIEVDLRTTKDNQIVLSHDNILVSTNGCIYCISNSDYDALNSLDFKYNYRFTSINNDISRRIEKSRIKKLTNKEFNLYSLDECLKTCDDKNLILDLKFDKNKDKFIEELDCELEKCDNADNILLQSDDLEFLKEIKEKYQEYPILGILKKKSDLDYIDDFDSLCIKKSLVTKDLVEKVFNSKKHIAIWTINTKEEVDDIVDILGDDYKNVIYITDYPDVIATCLHEKEKIKEKTSN